MKRQIIQITSLLALLLINQTALAAHPECSGLHCTSDGIKSIAIEQCKGNAEILGITEAEYKKRGGKAVTSEKGLVCTCNCSCVVADTSIATSEGYKLIVNLMEGQNVLTPLSIDFTSSRVEKLHVSDANGEQVQRTEFSNGSIVTSSLNHTFITIYETVVSADQLNIDDSVLDSDGNEITVVNVEQNILDNNQLYNLSVSTESKQPIDHVIDTAGVLSGDWLLQSTNDIIEEELFLRTSVVELFN